MKIRPNRKYLLLFACLGFLCLSATAQDLNMIGVTLLDTIKTNLNGAGIRVGQPEAAEDTNGFYWEINPSEVEQRASLFTYFSNGLYSTTFPNSLGGESGHAYQVGYNYYEPGTGVATNVAHVDNIEADDYYNNDIVNELAIPPLNITDAVVNQSFTFGSEDASDQKTIDTAYDNYSAKFRTLFVSAADNSGPVCPPGTSYNCISVGAFGGSSSYGPTIDNGRCKPDITAPAPETSFSTPQVAGAAAVLMQAAWRGDGGSDTNSAANMITIKALLLNGAVKPANWQNVPPEPLDTNYGTGVLNVFNSYEQLSGGKNSSVFSTNVPTGTLHPPITGGAAIAAPSGWDFSTNNSSSSEDSIKHYLFNITNSAGSGNFTVTTTLVWNRHKNKSAINNLELFLYNAANSNLVASSTSVVDNVQHLFVPRLAHGRYDLEVWKAGGSGIVSTNETYALAWGIYSMSLAAKRSGTNVYLSWPAYPEGFAVAGTASLTTPNWSTNNLFSWTYTNNQDVLRLSPTNSTQFFRLQTPDF